MFHCKYKTIFWKLEVGACRSSILSLRKMIGKARCKLFSLCMGKSQNRIRPDARSFSVVLFSKKRSDIVISMSNQILVKKTNSEQEFMNLNDFTRVLVLDENESSAKVYIEGKLIGTIFDSDIDRVRDAKPRIVEPEKLLKWLRK